MTYVYVKRFIDGKHLDMTREQAEAAVKRGGFEIVGEIFEKKEEEVVKEVKLFNCILCGFEGKNNQSLRMHRMKRHA